MESFFKPPSPLTDYDTKNWNLWKQKFTIYLKAANKEKTSEDIKIAILLSCIGDEGLDVYNIFTEDQKSTLQTILQAYDEYFLPKRSVPMETFKFNNLTQQEDQSIEQYLRVLKKQAKLCEFKCQSTDCSQSYEDRMIRDRLIVGIHDKEIQARLLRETDIGVNKIIEYCKAITLSKEHLKTLTRDKSTENIRVDIVKNLPPGKIKCSRCLYEHYVNKCPAYNKTCAICKLRGHFAKACKRNQDREFGSKKIHQKYEEEKGEEAMKIGRRDIPGSSGESRLRNGQDYRNYSRKQVRYIEQEMTEGDSDEDNLYVNECIKGNRVCWHEYITVEGVNIKFKLDSGSDTSIIPKCIFDNFLNKPTLKKSCATLISYGNFKFKPMGEVLLNCTYNNTIVKVNFIIVDFRKEVCY